MTLAGWRDIALLILIAEAFVLGLIPLALYYLAVKGLSRLRPNLLRWLRVLQHYTAQGATLVANIMRGLLTPFLFLSGLRAGTQRGIAEMRRR
jgi:hypothetical protein